MVITGKYVVENEPAYINPYDSIIEKTLTYEDISKWKRLVKKGTANALFGLSEMLGHKIKAVSLDIGKLPLNEIPALLGKMNAPGVGIYLPIKGEYTGHIMLIHDSAVAFQLVDLHLDMVPGATRKLGDIERCALEDIGNITGTFFLNTLADSAGIIIMPSPPSVIVDSVSAIMDIPLRFIMEKQDDALVAKVTFSADSYQMDGAFVVLPTDKFVKNITGRMEEREK
jgi:chemotaxis protein CheC